MTHTIYIMPNGMPWECKDGANDTPFRCTEELYDLVCKWAEVDWEYDGYDSGLLADWIEDHPEHWVDPEGVMPKCVAFLRPRFSLEAHCKVPRIQPEIPTYSTAFPGPLDPPESVW